MTGMLSGWFGSSSKPTVAAAVPEPTALQTQRIKQIEQLKNLNGYARVTEIQRDVEYRVIVNEATSLTLHISLPPQFPQERPIVRTSFSVIHPWVNEQMIVAGCPSINNFMVHSDLGRVLREVIDEFRSNPPQILTMPSSSYCAGGWVTHAQATQANTAASVMSHVNARPNYMPPYMPPSATTSHYYASTALSYYAQSPSLVAQSHMIGRASPSPGLDQARGGTEMGKFSAELGKLSLDEIKSLLANEDQLSEKITELPEVVSMTAERRGLRQDIEQLARSNVAKKLQVDDKKRAVLEKYDQLNDLRGRFEDNSRRQDDLHSTYDLTLVQDRLKLSALEAEEQAEAVAENFLAGKISLDEFDKTFMKFRMLGHVRRVKEDKLSQQLPNSFKTNFQ